MTESRRTAIALVFVAAVVAVFAFTHREQPISPATQAEPRPSTTPLAQAVAPVAPSARAPLVEPRAPSNALKRPASEDDYMRELLALESTDEERALALARKGDEWYEGSGRAAEARKAMTITLLADLGRMEEARALARAFMAAHPDSGYLPVVQGVTGIHPRPHPSSAPREHLAGDTR